MSENAENVITYRDLALRKDDVESGPIKDAFIGYVKDKFAKDKEKAKPIPETLALCIDGIKKSYEQFYTQIGINQIHWPEIIYTDSDLGKDRHRGKERRLGYSVPGHLIVREYIGLPIDVKKVSIEKLQKLREFTAAVVLIHELFHGHVPAVLRSTEHKPGRIARVLCQKTKVNFAVEKQGLAYIRSKKRGVVNAIEEGLAMKAQQRIITEVIDRFYHEETNMYLKLQQKIKNTQEDPDLPLEAIYQMGNISETEWMAYRNSINLVNFIEIVIPNFEILAAKARISHKTIALARVINKKFGKSGYSLLMSATEENADKIQKQLESMLG